MSDKKENVRLLMLRYPLKHRTTGFNFGGAQGLGGHGDVQSHVDNSNFTNISFDHLNLNHGDFNFGGAQAAHFEVPHH